MAEYSTSSPYSDTIQLDGFMEILEPRRIPAYEDDVVFTITESYRNRPDLLAFDLYKDSRLWWVFAVRNPNNIKDPVFDFVPGRKIYIPKKATLVEALGI